MISKALMISRGGLNKTQLFPAKTSLYVSAPGNLAVSLRILQKQFSACKNASFSHGTGHERQRSYFL